MKTTLKTGFTLAEVLIALALLGVVAAFAIPQVLQNARDAERNTVLRESLSILSELTAQAYLSGSIQKYEDFNAFLTTHLNTMTICPGNFLTENCYPENPTNLDDDPTAAYILKNGAMLIDVDHFTSPCGSSPTACYDTIVLDYNGPKGPNRDGQDRVVVDINLNSQAYLAIKPGQVGACQGYSATNPNTLLFQDLTR